MDKVSGQQISAKGLTWSYANLLHALHVRKGLGGGGDDQGDKTVYV